LQYVAVCCSVLHCVAVCCSVLQCVAVCCSVLKCVVVDSWYVCCNVLQCAAVCCSTLLQCVAADSWCVWIDAAHVNELCLTWVDFRDLKLECVCVCVCVWSPTLPPHHGPTIPKAKRQECKYQLAALNRLRAASWFLHQQHQRCNIKTRDMTLDLESKTWFLDVRHDSWMWDMILGCETWFLMCNVRHDSRMWVNDSWSSIWDMTHECETMILDLECETWLLSVRHDSWWWHDSWMWDTILDVRCQIQLMNVRHESECSKTSTVIFHMTCIECSVFPGSVNYLDLERKRKQVKRKHFGQTDTMLRISTSNNEIFICNKIVGKSAARGEINWLSSFPHQKAFATLPK